MGKGDPADPRPAVAPRLPLARARWPVVVIWDSVVRRVLSCLPTQWPFSPDLFSVGAAAASSGGLNLPLPASPGRGGGTLLVSCPEPSETLMEPVPSPPPQVLLTAGSKFPGG